MKQLRDHNPNAGIVRRKAFVAVDVVVFTTAAAVQCSAVHIRERVVERHEDDDDNAEKSQVKNEKENMNAEVGTRTGKR